MFRHDYKFHLHLHLHIRMSHNKLNYRPEKTLKQNKLGCQDSVLDKLDVRGIAHLLPHRIAGMKRQRVNTEPNGSYGYGYSSYGDPSQTTVSGASAFAPNPSGVNPQARPGRPQETSLSHGMQPNLQPNMQPGMAGTQQGSGVYNGVPMNMNGMNMGNQYGMVGLGTAGQLGQGLSTSTTPSMSQNLGQNPGSNVGPQMGHTAMPDMGANMLHGLGSGMGQNMMQSMASNMSMAPNMGGTQLEAQAGLAPALGQGMGISEGFPCVKLRGLPFDANEQDIAIWLVWDVSGELFCTASVTMGAAWLDHLVIVWS